MPGTARSRDCKVRAAASQLLLAGAGVRAANASDTAASASNKLVRGDGLVRSKVLLDTKWVISETFFPVSLLARYSGPCDSFSVFRTL